MGPCTCVPGTVYDVLHPFKPLVRCAQARPLVIFCCLLGGIIRDPGAGTRKGVCPHWPPHWSYGALIRMRRSGQWDAHAVMTGLTDQV
jgi:hypothetical protein